MTHLRCWLAYGFDGPLPPPDAEPRLRLVEAHYGLAARPGTGAETPVRAGHIGRFNGIAIWDFQPSLCRWPAWAEDEEIGVASVHVPFGWSLAGASGEPADAALALAHRLLSDASTGACLKPPAILAVHRRADDRLTLLNDAYGYARLYELRFDAGWVWSNRLGALFLFAGVVPEADPAAWCCLADVGWFMGRTTPMLGARLLEPGTVVHCRPGRSPRRERSGLLEAWLCPGAPQPPGEELAARLVATVRSCRDLWPDEPLVDLTGGHDSRLVAAACIAGGVEARFFTAAPPDEEVEIAASLLAEVGREGQHQRVRLDAAADGGTAEELHSRLARLMHLYDGHFAPETFLKPLQPQLEHPRHAHLSGMAGELVRRTPLDRWRDRRGAAAAGSPVEDVHRRIGFPFGVGEAARVVTARQIATILDDGSRLGLEPSSLLHYFYVMERIRRWSGANLGIDRVAPLIDGPFLQTALGLSREQRVDNRLVRQLTARLVPEWSEIPYFKAGRSRRLPRAGRYGDALWNDLYRDAMERKALWEGLFEPRCVRSLRWLDRGGLDAPVDRQLFARLLWRVHFDAHVEGLRKRINQAGIGSAPAQVAPVCFPVPPPPPRRWTLLRAVVKRLWRKVSP